MASPDLNGDGYTDLIVATTSGAFGKVHLISSNYALTVIAGDFNHDGKMDLAALQATAGGNAIVFYPGLGNGSFGSSVDTLLGGNPADMAAADFNGDGNLDLAIGDVEKFTVRMWLGNGSG